MLSVLIFNYDYDHECNDDNTSFYYCHNLIINDIDINFLSNFKRIIVIHIIVTFENDCMTNFKNKSNQIMN